MSRTVYDEFNPPPAHALYCHDPSLTQQQYRDECDINTIMSRYTQDGLVPLGTTKTATYDDFSTVDDYFSAMLLLNNARDQFNQLPAQVRARFHNDPAELLDFIHEPNNLEEARKLGMLKPDAPQPTQPATTGTVPAPAPAAPAAPAK